MSVFGILSTQQQRGELPASLLAALQRGALPTSSAGHCVSTAGGSEPSHTPTPSSIGRQQLCCLGGTAGRFGREICILELLSPWR